MSILLYNPIQIITPFDNKPVRGSKLNKIKIITDSHILIKDGKIKDFIKKGDMLPADIHDLINCTNKTIIPGLIDSHTHLVWGGYREEEFEQRATGVPYELIAKKGGGIANTVSKTRNASFQELYDASRKRLDRMICNGTTSVEIKSGYGLSFEDEVKQLNVIKKLKEEFPITIKSTFLGAHDFPIEYKNDRKKYIDIIINKMLPYIRNENLADFVDVFCDSIAYTNEETEIIIKRSKELGLNIRLHVDEIENTEGTSLAAEYNALSADHLIKISDRSIEKLAESDTVANLLPGTSFYLKKPFAPARKLIENDCLLSIATDLNPGSSVLERMPMAMFLAVWGYSMTINEVYNCATINSAYSLRINEDCGCIARGNTADLLILDCINYKHLIYNYSANLVEKVLVKGKVY